MIREKLQTNLASLAGPSRKGSSFHKLHQDIGQSITPYNGRSEKFKDLKYEITGEDAEKANKILKQLASHRQYDKHTLISDVLNTLSSKLFFNGEFHFQIDWTNLEEIKLEYIANERLFRIMSLYVQVIPSKDRRNNDKTYIRYAFAKSIWKVNMPSFLYSTFEYKIRSRALKLADAVSPEFGLQEFAKSDGSFDLSKYSFKRVCFKKILFLKLHWSLRSSINEYTTEYFTVYEHLQYKLVQTKIRIFIIAQLNSLLSRLGVKAIVVQYGLPSVEKINGVIDELERGENGFEGWEEVSYF